MSWSPSCSLCRESQVELREHIDSLATGETQHGHLRSLAGGCSRGLPPHLLGVPGALGLLPHPEPKAPTPTPGFCRHSRSELGRRGFTRAFTPKEQCGSARLSCTATAGSSVTSSWLGNGGHMLLLVHVNHLKRLMFHSWHPQYHLGSPGASCCAWDLPDKGAVMNLSETTVFCTQQNTVNELFITMLPSSSTTTKPDTQGFN